MAEVRGIQDFRKAVEELTSDMRRKVVNAAIRAALRPTLNAAKGNSAFRTGVLRAHIGIFKSRIFRGQGGVIGGFVGVRKDSARRVKGTRVQLRVKGQDPYYGKFLERGTSKMRARPFLKPAGESTWGQVLDIFQAEIAKRIAKANKRV